MTLDRRFKNGYKTYMSICALCLSIYVSYLHFGALSAQRVMSLFTFREEMSRQITSGSQRSVYLLEGDHFFQKAELLCTHLCQLCQVKTDEPHSRW